MTLLCYAAAAIFGYTIGALGPAMPLLRADLGIDRTVGGLHFTVVALGTLAAGLVGERPVRHWGRRVVFWAAGAAVGAGALLLGLGRHPALTLGGAALIGGSGSLMLIVVQSSLADLHQGRRAVALTEANTAWSLGAIPPALVIGALAGSGIGWRPALAVPVLLLGAAFIVSRRQDFEIAGAPEHPGRRRPLPRSYWPVWAAVVPAAGIEWSIGAWGAGYLVDVGAASAAVASTLMTFYFGAMAVGRLAAGRITRHLKPATLLVAANLVGLVGFLAFWLSGGEVLRIGGLFLTGFGVSVVFPMLLVLALGAAPGRADEAAARVSVAVGLAVVTAPQLLGWVADRAGMRTAFGIVPGLFVAVVALAMMGASRRPASG